VWHPKPGRGGVQRWRAQPAKNHKRALPHGLEGKTDAGKGLWKGGWTTDHLGPSAFEAQLRVTCAQQIGGETKGEGKKKLGVRPGAGFTWHQLKGSG